MTSYFVEFSKNLETFLNYKGIKNLTSEADITCIEYGGNFEALMIEFNDSVNDMTIYKNANGSKYHEAAVPIVKIIRTGEILNAVINIHYKGKCYHVGYFTNDVLNRILKTSYYELRSFLDGFNVNDDEMMQDFASLILWTLNVSNDELEKMGQFDLNILSFKKD
jgi:hypothetical protein